MRFKLLLALLFLRASAQAPLPLTQAGVVELRQLPELAPQVAALPRVVPGSGVTPQVAEIVNRHLAALDADLRNEIRECRRSTRTRHMESDYQREVTVTLRGPRFLSLYTSDTYDCGGPHPDDFQLTLTYDLQTGKPINWLAYLPAEAKADTTSGPRATRLSYVVWAPLLQMAYQQADSGPDSDCQAQFKAGSSVDFNLSLQSDGKIAFRPVLLPHYTSAMCSVSLDLDQATARRLGVSPALLDVLAAAARTKQ